MSLFTSQPYSSHSVSGLTESCPVHAQPGPWPSKWGKSLSRFLFPIPICRSLSSCTLSYKSAFLVASNSNLFLLCSVRPLLHFPGLVGKMSPGKEPGWIWGSPGVSFLSRITDLCCLLFNAWKQLPHVFPSFTVVHSEDISRTLVFPSKTETFHSILYLQMFHILIYESERFNIFF